MKYETVASSIIGLAAIAIATSVVHREFFVSTPAPPSPLFPPEYLRDWRDITRAGVTIGDSSAAVRIIEFADFQCPFCKQYQNTLRSVQAKYGRSVARVFVHYPLNIHASAMGAARAAECAREQGRFAEMEDALFAKQDSLGVRPWSAFARDARVLDSIRFTKCASGNDTLPNVSRGIALAQRFQIMGTPTIIVNGWKFVGGPPDSVLSATIDDLLQGKQPRAAKRKG